MRPVTSAAFYAGVSERAGRNLCRGGGGGPDSSPGPAESHPPHPRDRLPSFHTYKPTERGERKEGHRLGLAPGLSGSIALGLLPFLREERFFGVARSHTSVSVTEATSLLTCTRHSAAAYRLGHFWDDTETFHEGQSLSFESDQRKDSGWPEKLP